MSKITFLDVGQATDYLRLKSKQSLYNLVSQGRVPYLKLGRRVLFEEAALATWVKSGCPLPTSTHQENPNAERGDVDGVL